MTTTGIVDIEMIEKEVEKDQELQKIIAELKKWGGSRRKIPMEQWQVVI